MIDQSTIDLSAIIRQSVHLDASHHELRGRCPFHNGKSATSLKVWQEEDIWHWCCHAGCGGGDALSWIAKRDGLNLKQRGDFVQAVAMLGLDAASTPTRTIADPQPTEPITAPSGVWQDAARTFVERCADALWSDYHKPLGWLQGRGFRDGLLVGYDIGYNADDRFMERAAWGLPEVSYIDSDGNPKTKTHIWLPRGIVIPWFVGRDQAGRGGELWKIIIRRPISSDTWEWVPGNLWLTNKEDDTWWITSILKPSREPMTTAMIARQLVWTIERTAAALAELEEQRMVRHPTKYYQVPGCSNALFNADRLASERPVQLCEAALDALAVQQEAGDLVTPVATGTTGARSLRWIAPLSATPARLLSFDADSGGENPLAYWRGVFPDAKEWRPYYDDPATMLQHGGDVRAWVQHGLAAAQ